MSASDDSAAGVSGEWYIEAGVISDTMGLRTYGSPVNRSVAGSGNAKPIATEASGEVTSSRYGSDGCRAEIACGAGEANSAAEAVDAGAE